MSYDSVPGLRAEQLGSVLALTLDRAERRNAVNDEMLDAMVGHLAAVGTDESVRVIRITADGSDFCAGSDLIALSDASGQVFAIDATGVTSIAKLFEPITTLATSPTAHRFAVGAGREVVIYDLDKRGEIAHHKLGATITALAWSRDGRRLAAATASTEVAIWQP